MKTDDFKSRIYMLLKAIPAGSVTSYGRLAQLAGYPGRARMVGSILKQLPEGSRLPWHRVLTASGKPAFPVGSDAFERQIVRLQQEGVTLSESHRVAQAHWWET